MIGVQDEDAIHRAGENGIGLVVLAGHREAHAQEIGRIVEVVFRIDERLANRILVRHRRNRRHFRNHADGGNHPLGRVGNVRRVVIERRERPDAAGHDRHWVRVPSKALIEPAHLLVHHGVVGDTIVEVGFLRGGGELPVEQEIAGLEEIAVLG